jgi:hypothetical protein
MSSEILNRIETIAAELLQGEDVEIADNGEGYYIVASTVDGRKSNFPPVWLSPSSSEQQVRDKLTHHFAQNRNPDVSPDDLSAPNLQNAGRQRTP